LKWTVEEAIQAFQKGGYALGDPLDEMYVPLSIEITDVLEHSTSTHPLFLRNFARDAHIENLLLFHPQSQLTDTPEYSDGRLILQDKASCFPAVVLAPPAYPESVIIDATAAPGNKTSHLSALVGNQGKVQTAPFTPCQPWAGYSFHPPLSPFLDSRSLPSNATASVMAPSGRCWPEPGAVTSKR
jgi:hypothetical protein